MLVTRTKKGKTFAFIMYSLCLTRSRNRQPWFSTQESYSPAVHRVKQAMFHCAVVNDITTNPLPPPHPELLKFFEPPKRVVKRARDAIEECKAAFKVKEGKRLRITPASLI